MIRVLGPRVLVALPPDEDETVSEAGLVLVRDPDKFKTPTRGLVVQLGEKSGTVDVDEACSAVREYFDELRHHIDPSGWRDVESSIVADIKRLAPAPFDVQVNDCVLFLPTAGEQYEQDGINYVVVHEAEILGVVEKTQSEAA